MSRNRKGHTISDSTWPLDTGFYAEVYPDLSHLSAKQLVEHWRRVGAREERFPCRDAVTTAAQDLAGLSFDPLVYLDLNPDLAKGGIDTENRALVHFVTVGREEGRPFRMESLGSRPIGAGPAGGRQRETWHAATPFHERVFACDEPTDLASVVLGRDMESDRAVITPWLDPLDVAQRVAALLTSDEALATERALTLIPADEFVLYSYMKAFNRPPGAAELDELVTALDYGELRRDRLLLQRMTSGLYLQIEAEREDDGAVVDAARGAGAESDLTFLLLGTGRMVTRADWNERQAEVARSRGSRPSTTMRTRLTGQLHGDGPLAAVISSIYRPGDFLEPFLRQLEAQTIFDRVEVVCILVDPLAEEQTVLERWAAQHPNVILHVDRERLGIYQAWNVGVTLSTAPLLTNANVDDLRRNDSLEIQVQTLHQQPWADVVYQDVLYTLDASLSFSEIEEIGFATKLPPVTARSLLGMNSPHNAPMWRRTLHDELGPFDDSFSSAGDYEFWLRCVGAGKHFFKTRDAHVSYFVNPRGLSTRPGGAGVTEAAVIGRRYAHLMKYDEAPFYVAPAVGGGPRLPRADRLSLGAIDYLATLRNGERLTHG